MNNAKTLSELAANWKPILFTAPLNKLKGWAVESHTSFIATGSDECNIDIYKSTTGITETIFKVVSSYIDYDDIKQRKLLLNRTVDTFFNGLLSSLDFTKTITLGSDGRIFTDLVKHRGRWYFVRVINRRLSWEDGLNDNEDEFAEEVSIAYATQPKALLSLLNARLTHAKLLTALAVRNTGISVENLSANPLSPMMSIGLKTFLYPDANGLTINTKEFNNGADAIRELFEFDLTFDPFNEWGEQYEDFLVDATEAFVDGDIVTTKTTNLPFAKEIGTRGIMYIIPNTTTGYPVIYVFKFKTEELRNTMSLRFKNSTDDPLYNFSNR